MTTRRFASLALLAALPLAGVACLDVTEPESTTNCSTIATTYTTTPGFVTLPSGLQYRDVVVGPGAQVNAGDRLVTNYAACVPSGQSFSGALGTSHLVFTVGQGQVIPGLDQGVVGMHLGGRRQLVIPEALGYGASGSPGGFYVPQGTLIITVDALGFH